MTLVGSPPNAIAASAIAERTGEPISFVSWLRYGLPIGAILLVATWFVLCHGVFRLRAVAIDPLPAESRRPFTAASRATLAIFALTVLAWLTRPLWARLAPGVRDESIAVAAAILLLVLPTRLHPFETLLDWRDLKRLPWGVLILFGGGLSIAAALEHHGVAAWLAADMRSLGDAPMIVVLLILAAGACFGSELASNTALTATAMPVLAALADAGDMPLERLAVTGALGASLAFMLPVGTPPNAMAYATGHVSSGQMAKAGFLLNLAAIATVILVVTLMP